MPSPQALPLEFQASFAARDAYPTNLVHRTISTYPSALQEYRTRLDRAAEGLLEKDIQKIEVAFRDIKTDNGQGQGSYLPNPFTSTTRNN